MSVPLLAGLKERPYGLKDEVEPADGLQPQAQRSSSTGEAGALLKPVKAAAVAAPVMPKMDLTQRIGSFNSGRLLLTSQNVPVHSEAVHVLVHEDQGFVYGYANVYVNGIEHGQ